MISDETRCFLTTSLFKLFKIETKIGLLKEKLIKNILTFFFYLHDFHLLNSYLLCFIVVCLYTYHMLL